MGALQDIKISARAGQAWTSLLDLLFPPHCPACNDPVSTQGTLCPVCWASITYITPPVCHQCGYPFEYDMGSEALCPTCISTPPSFSMARSALQYDEKSRGLILAYKHGDQTDQTRSFAGWMLQAGKPLLTDDPILVPVPLHPRRLITRRYNQAALLADGIGRMGHLQVDKTSLCRVRATESQGTKSLSARHKNVRGAFSVRKGRQARIEGQTILLIDDVYTTGATLNECAKILLKSGAREVRALTLSRVVRAAVLPGIS